MLRLQCSFLSFIFYLLGIYSFLLFTTCIRYKNLNSYRILGNFNLFQVNTELFNNTPIEFSYPSINITMRQHYKNMKKAFSMFNKNTNLNTVKCSTKNVSSVINPILTNSSQVLTSLLSSPNHIAQTIKQFNFSDALRTDYLYSTTSYVSQNLTTIKHLSSTLNPFTTTKLISKFKKFTFITKFLHTSNLTTSRITNIGVGSSCHQYSNLITMAMSNKPPLHKYSNVFILMEPIIQAKENKSLFLIVGILSTAESRDLRDAIRDTWGSRSLLSSLKRYPKTK